ncbi:MAG: radical SAM family heme chaperone HemW [Paludibacteraceae bacterium]|nr:radical SAM family heme chaperone HemW [Paludibacteraceae bacterium]
MQSIYIHTPFCVSRCKYCDFFSTTCLDRRHEYVDAVLAEWEQRKLSSPDNPIQTLYMGGGTPSLLEISDIQRLISAIATKDTVEITLEANPGDLSPDKLRALRAIGINRLSIGIQSFRNPLLRLIGRRHTARQARLAVQWAQQAGFDNISIDLIYALPGQNMMQWAMDVKKAVRLHVRHISCYCLTYEDGTEMHRLLHNGAFRATSEHQQNRMYRYLCRVLERNGYEHYEVSNFALPGYRSRHNSTYWNDTPYIGLGAGAHSYDGQIRSWNPNDLEAYISGINSHSLQRESETLTGEQKHMEQIMLGLRTCEGIPASLVENRLPKVQDYIRRGLLQQKGDRLAATQQGLYILNRIIDDLI